MGILSRLVNIYSTVKQLQRQKEEDEYLKNVQAQRGQYLAEMGVFPKRTEVENPFTQRLKGPQEYYGQIGGAASNPLIASLIKNKLGIPEKKTKKNSSNTLGERRFQETKREKLQKVMNKAVEEAMSAGENYASGMTADWRSSYEKIGKAMALVNKYKKYDPEVVKKIRELKRLKTDMQKRDVSFKGGKKGKVKSMQKKLLAKPSKDDPLGFGIK